VTLGEDFRSGRWWWEHNLEGGADKECGLHVKASN
jgi:phosphoadenosine phosphosulfate reductase